MVFITRAPKGQNNIGSTFVFRQRVDGRCKARPVIQRQPREAGIDYGKPFTPIRRIGSLLVMLTRACQLDWAVCQVDDEVSILQSKIGNDILVRSLRGHDTKYIKIGARVVLKTNRRLYSLSQSPALWQDTIHVKKLGIILARTSSDNFVYTHGRDDPHAKCQGLRFKWQRLWSGQAVRESSSGPFRHDRHRRS